MEQSYNEKMSDLAGHLSELDLKILKQIVEFTINENHDIIFDRHLTSYQNWKAGPAIIRAKLSKFVELKIFKEDSDESGQSRWWEFTADGAEFSYNLLGAEYIPAADRFVPINHNSQEVAEAKSALEKLEKRIKTSNELTASQSERLAMISEIQGVRQLLDQPAVRIASIWAATKNSGILAWLATHTADAAITALATEVVGHLFKICGLS